jgi:fructose/tagatose bisphosphate aldolase
MSQIPPKPPIDFDQLATEIAFAPLAEKRERALQAIQDLLNFGVYPASIARWYRAIAAGKLPWMTIPAFNLRGNTYQVARRVWRMALKFEVGAVIFELAPSEADVSDQSFEEYTALVLTAAASEGYQGPVFLQGDHFDIPANGDLEAVQNLCQQAIQAGMYQIDVDGCHLFGADETSLAAFHQPNVLATAEIIQFIRNLQPTGIEIVIGGEVGVIGGTNTTPTDLQAFLTAVQAALPPDLPGLDKISAQTGTRHGGVVNPDGSAGRMELDLQLANQLSHIARSDFGLAGLVQHGASTLQIAELAQLKTKEVIEVHLATGIQNIIFDHPAFPPELRARIKAELVQPETGPEGALPESEDGLSPAQQFYNVRWAAWGPFKRELWAIPEAAWDEICVDLDEWFAQVFQALGVTGQYKNMANYYSLERPTK